ncbi:MAG: DNA polymerase III subunit delta' [Lyngbya sp.]|nr:DNA polymerase III subunit delta' [Lyngbya sp.]
MSSENAFSPLIGQPQAVELLTQTVIQNRIAPAYLFVGSSGIGRSLAARCFIEFLFCNVGKKPLNPQQVRHRIQARNHPDLLWVEPTYLHQGKRLSASEAEVAGIKRRSPPQIRLEQIREIGQFLSRPPLEASRLVVVLEQAETMAEAAANGLLKTLEEPGNATLILIAPGVDSLLSTLVSRCAKIPFYRLDEQAMAQVLKQQKQEEILSHPEMIAMSQGSPGEAMVCWQQLQALSPEFLERVKQPPKTVYEALSLAKDISQTLDTEAQIWLIDYLQHCYWKQQQNPNLTNSFFLQQLEKARKLLLGFVQPRLVWECTFLSFCQT